jgi:ATP-dependent RNA helicase DeaD
MKPQRTATGAPSRAGKGPRDEAPAELTAAEEAAATATFDDLELTEPLRRAVADAGFESPTPIQARAIPVLLAGRDLIGQAQTGTGKTAAFGLPLLQRIDPASPRTQALVMVPTRELAVQAAGEIHRFARHTGVRTVPVYGGQPIDRQFRALRAGAQVVVGTPGRVLDHIRRGSLDLSGVSFCALDEADEMLAFGFIEDIETILAELPPDRQLALFSATMPPRITGLARRFMPDAENVSIRARRRTVETTNQTYYEVAPGPQARSAGPRARHGNAGPDDRVLPDAAGDHDLGRGASPARLRCRGAARRHGAAGAGPRDAALRDGQADLLIATDVAARGLDIETVTHVINYDMPWDVEQYIHRIGRTVAGGARPATRSRWSSRASGATCG